MKKINIFMFTVLVSFMLLVTASAKKDVFLYDWSKELNSVELNGLVPINNTLVFKNGYVHVDVYAVDNDYVSKLTYYNINGDELASSTLENNKITDITSSGNYIYVFSIDNEESSPYVIKLDEKLKEIERIKIPAKLKYNEFPISNRASFGLGFMSNVNDEITIHYHNLDGENEFYIIDKDLNGYNVTEDDIISEYYHNLYVSKGLIDLIEEDEKIVSVDSKNNLTAFSSKTVCPDFNAYSYDDLGKYKRYYDDYGYRYKMYFNEEDEFIFYFDEDNEKHVFSNDSWGKYTVINGVKKYFDEDGIYGVYNVEYDYYENYYDAYWDYYYDDCEEYSYIYLLDGKNNKIWSDESYEYNSIDNVRIVGDYIIAIGKRGNYYLESDILIYNMDGKLVQTIYGNEEVFMKLESSPYGFAVHKYNSICLADSEDYDEEDFEKTECEMSLETYYLPLNIKTKINGKGTIKVNSTAKFGENVLYEIIPGKGFDLKEIKITDKDGNIIETDGNTFIMVGSDVTIKATLIPSILNNPETKDIGIATLVVISILGFIMFLANYKKMKFMK